MTTKTCNNCGWVLAIQDPKTHCPVCGTKFTTGICTICKQPVVYYRHNRLVCRHCYDTVTRKPDANAKLAARRKKVYEEWRAKIDKIPKDYPALTDKQWLDACKHFEGCACCGDQPIEARGYFIPFKHGGRYCDWNVIPLCAKCATAMRKQPNPFTSHSRPKRLIEIIDYLEDKLNAACKT